MLDQLISSINHSIREKVVSNAEQHIKASH